MTLGVVGVSCRETPMDVMNEVSVSGTQKLEWYAQIQDELEAEGVILSTCNRVEVYYRSDRADISTRMRQAFLARFPAAAATLYCKEGREAVHHLFRVAAGFESLVTGEDQILGQVREAHEFAMREQGEMKTLNKLFLGAVTAAKKVKTAFPISSIPLSTSYIGIKLLRENGGIAGQTALVLGAGRMSRLAVEYLLESSVRRVMICNRTPRVRLEGLEDERLEFHAFAERYALLPEADLVVSATSAPHIVLEADRIPPRKKPLAILDLALPYDVQPESRARADVTLYNMETLRQISGENAQKRGQLCATAEEALAREAEELLTGLRRMKADRVIARLNRQCDTLARDALDFLDTSLAPSDRERAVLEKVLRSALKKLVREPIRALKKLDGQELDGSVAAAEYLFGLRDTPEASAPREPEESRNQKCE